MYMSMRRYNVNPAKAEQLFETVDRGFGPIVSAMPGFVNYYVFDSGDGAVGSISIFEDKASLDACNAKSALWVKQSLSDFNLEPHAITEARVRAKH